MKKTEKIINFFNNIEQLNIETKNKIIWLRDLLKKNAPKMYKQYVGYKLAKHNEQIDNKPLAKDENLGYDKNKADSFEKWMKEEDIKNAFDNNDT